MKKGVAWQSKDNLTPGPRPSIFFLKPLEEPLGTACAEENFFTSSFFFNSLTQVHEETGILLIKPKDLIPRLEEIKEDVKEIDEADILAASNIAKQRAKLRKAELQAQVAAEKEPPLSDVEGTGVTRDIGQESSWKVCTLVYVTLLELANRPRLARTCYSNISQFSNHKRYVISSNKKYRDLQREMLQKVSSYDIFF